MKHCIVCLYYIYYIEVSIETPYILVSGIDIYQNNI